jgi:hypothetical protein
MSILLECPRKANGWIFQQTKLNVGGNEMDRIKEVTINEAVLHVLDSNADEPVLNEYKLELNENNYKYILKHIERVLKDDELKYALFNNERSVLKEISYDYLNGQKDLLGVSKEAARQLFTLMKSNINIASCDLLVVSFYTEYGPFVGMMKLDYVKNFTHKIDFIENQIGINLSEQTALPSGSKLQKCAFIKAKRENQEYDLLVLDKQNTSINTEEYGANYFISNYLNCELIDNDRDQTKALMVATERWTRSNFNNDADRAESLRSDFKKIVQDKEQLNVKELAGELIKDSESAKNDFIQFITAQGIQENVTVDKDYVEKKLKRTRLQIDRNIDLYIDQESYHDKSKFEVIRNGDGSINLVLKHIMGYIEK